MRVRELKQFLAMVPDHVEVMLLCESDEGFIIQQPLDDAEQVHDSGKEGPCLLISKQAGEVLADP